MVKVQNPMFDTTKQSEQSFTLTDFPRGWLKIIPTQDGHCYLAMDIMVGYEDGTIRTKTLKILVDELGQAYMIAPKIDENDFAKEKCYTPIPNDVIDICGKVYYSNNIFGFNLEHYVYSKYTPEESVFKFYALSPNLYGETMGRDTNSYLNSKAVGHIAKYVNSHQKEINERLEEIAKVAQVAPTEEFSRLESDYKEAFKKYTDGTGSYNKFLELNKKYKEAREYRNHSKPITFNFVRVIENENYNKRFKILEDEE